MDVLLIHPSDKGAHQKFQKNETAFGSTGLTGKEPPVWAGLLATYIRKKGFSVEILDTHVEDLGTNDSAKIIASIKPLLAAIVVYGYNPSASTRTMVSAGEIAKTLKQISPEQKILFVGGHVAALPQRTLREEAIDFTCTGEGPVTLVELIQALRAGTEEFHKVRGLCYWNHKSEGAIATNPPAPLVMNLDNEMPTMAYDLLHMKKYVAHHWHCYGEIPRQPYLAFYASLGCPFKCSFCCIQAPFRNGEKLVGLKTNSWRHWSAETVVSWIDYFIQKWPSGIINIKFADEMPDPRQINQICDLIIQRGYGEQLNIWCYDRVDTSNFERYEKMRKAGFRWIALGIEAAETNVRQNVNKGKFSEDRIFKAIQDAHNAGLYVIANYIFGLPEDNMESMQRTLELSIELETEGLNYYCAMAFPGSALYQQILRENASDLPRNWIGYSQHNEFTDPLSTKHCPSAQVLAFRDYAYRAGQSNPKYLALLRDKFGDETAKYVYEISRQEFVRRYRDEKLYRDMVSSFKRE